MFYRKCWTDRAGFWHKGFPLLSLLCVLRNLCICKMCILAVVQTLNFDDCCALGLHCGTPMLFCKYYINLVRLSARMFITQECPVLFTEQLTWFRMSSGSSAAADIRKWFFSLSISYPCTPLLWLVLDLLWTVDLSNCCEFVVHLVVQQINYKSATNQSKPSVVWA